MTFGSVDHHVAQMLHIHTLLLSANLHFFSMHDSHVSISSQSIAALAAQTSAV